MGRSYCFISLLLLCANMLEILLENLNPRKGTLPSSQVTLPLIAHPKNIIIVVSVSVWV